MASSSRLAAAVLTVAVLWPSLATALDPQPPVLVSVQWDTGDPTWGLCTSRLQFGSDSRYLSFACYGDDLTPGDTNDRRDTVLLDRVTGAIELVSVSSDGQQTYYDSAGGDPSEDGHQVAFASAGPLHPDYWPPPMFEVGRPAIYLRHLNTGQTDLVSRDAFGQALTGSLVYYGANFMRGEVLFHYTGDIRTGPGPGPFGAPSQLWTKSWITGAVELISATPTGELSSGGLNGSFSATGRYIVFVGGHALGPPARPQDANIYVRDRDTGTVERLTWPWAGGEFLGESLMVRRPRITADGRYVVFSTTSTEIHPDAASTSLLHVYLLDRQTGDLEHVSPTPGYSSYNDGADISDDGRYVAWFSRNFSFQGPPDPPADMRAIWVLDRDTGQRVNVTASLGPLYQESDINLDLAPDGSAIAFTWRVGDPTSPVFGPPLVYTVELRGTPSPPPPSATPVPATSAWLVLVLAGGVLLLAAGRHRRPS